MELVSGITFYLVGKGLYWHVYFVFIVLPIPSLLFPCIAALLEMERRKCVIHTSSSLTRYGRTGLTFCVTPNTNSVRVKRKLSRVTTQAQ